MAYKYATAYDWLMSHVDEIISTAEQNVKDSDPDAMLDSTNQLRSIISTLAIKHDSDTIQDELDNLFSWRLLNEVEEND